MIQLKNTTDSQVFHILKNNPKLKSTPKRFQSKDYLANKVGTFKILPDEGYFAMTSVNLDVDFVTDSKSETYTENGEYQVLPNEDSVGLSDVTITVDVQPPLQDKQVTYNELGTYNVEADEGYYGLDNVEITFEYPLEEITDTVTVNGTYTYEPSEGYKGLSKVDVTVNTSGLPIDLQGIGWSQSDIDTFVDPYATGINYAKQIQDNWDPNTINVNEKWRYNSNLTIFPNLDMRNVTNLNWAFQGSDIQLLPHLEIPNVTQAYAVFGNTPIVNADLSGWKGQADYGNGGNNGVYGMFSNCSNLQSVTFSPEFTFIACASMFYGLNLGNLRRIENLNVSRCTNMDSMFQYVNFKNFETDFSDWDTSSVRIFQNMFANTSNLPNGIEQFNTSSATSFYSMFSNATYIPTKDFSKWDTSNVTTFYNMFRSADFVDVNGTLDLSGWDFNSVRPNGVDSMFAFASDIKSVNLTNAKMDKMSNMNNMWYYAYTAEIILDGVTLPKVAMNWDANYAHKHTLDTVLGILNALPDITGDGLSLTCKLGTQDLAQLTDEQKAIGTSKGWTLA